MTYILYENYKQETASKPPIKKTQTKYFHIYEMNKVKFISYFSLASCLTL